MDCRNVEVEIPIIDIYNTITYIVKIKNVTEILYISTI